jgi:hypothetical protein
MVPVDRSLGSSSVVFTQHCVQQSRSGDQCRLLFLPLLLLLLLLLLLQTLHMQMPSLPCFNITMEQRGGEQDLVLARREQVLARRAPILLATNQPLNMSGSCG